MEGKLIALEGIDGSGTTTQANLLHSALLGSQFPVHVTEEPSQGPIGSLIRQILHGRLISIGLTGQGVPSWSTMALLFAADRLDHLESEILPNLNDGINVISDRYIYSSIVYQTVTSGDDANMQWVELANKYAKRADLIFFLDVDPKEAQKRRLARRIGHELYEDLPLQEKIAEKYREYFKNSQDGKIVIVDGNLPVEEVGNQCLEETKSFLNKRD